MKYCEHCKQWIPKEYFSSSECCICEKCCDELAGNIPLDETDEEENLTIDDWCECCYGEGQTLSELLSQGIDPF
jgi:hypothetical protein